jgi:threonine/homoserine/homoserine lactone efflux protein
LVDHTPGDYLLSTMRRALSQAYSSDLALAFGIVAGLQLWGLIWVMQAIQAFR